MTKKTVKGKDILKLAMNPDNNDAEAKTLREYFVALLTTLIHEGEGFSGKRPFGNSGWEYELFVPLVQAGLVEGEIDDEGGIYDVDKDSAYDLINEAIQAL